MVFLAQVNLTPVYRERNEQRSAVHGRHRSSHVKDAFHEDLMRQNTSAVNPINWHENCSSLFLDWVLAICNAQVRLTTSNRLGGIYQQMLTVVGTILSSSNRGTMSGREFP